MPTIIIHRLSTTLYYLHTNQSIYSLVFENQYFLAQPSKLINRLFSKLKNSIFLINKISAAKILILTLSQ